MFATVLAVTAVIAWSATAAVAVADLVGTGTRTDRVAKAGLMLAAGFTIAACLAQVLTHGLEGLVGRGYRLLFLATIISVGALALRRKSALRAVTAFTAPFGALLVASQLFSQHGESVELDMMPLLMVHIGLVLVGIGGFALAAFVSTLYLLQERQLRTRNFGPLFHRLPSLEELDTAAFRLVVWGFVSYTAALVLGFMWTAQAHADAGFGRVGLAVVAWGVFAAVIHTRVTTGWRGRQSALMTIVGCIATYVVLAGYMIR